MGRWISRSLGGRSVGRFGRLVAGSTNRSVVGWSDTRSSAQSLGRSIDPEFGLARSLATGRSFTWFGRLVAGSANRSVVGWSDSRSSAQHRLANQSIQSSDLLARSQQVVHSLGRSFGHRAPGQFIGRSAVGRAIVGQAVGRSIVWSLSWLNGYSISRSVDGSVDQSVGGLFGGSFGRSVCWSVIRQSVARLPNRSAASCPPFGASIARAVGRSPLDRSIGCSVG